MKRIRTIALMLLLAITICGCSSQAELGEGQVPNEAVISSNTPDKESSTAGTEPENSKTEPVKMETTYEIRDGISGFTLKHDDLPSEYQMSSDFSYESMNQRPPLPDGNQTVLSSIPNPEQTEVFYLWEEGNVPAQTNVPSDMTGNYDPYDFRPYVTALTVPEGVEVKGAVILLAGGAFQFRGDYTDTLPTAVQLREYGYRCFVVDYRLRPCSQEEGALDVARVVRFIRKNAEVYGIDPDDISVTGYSAGGIQAGEFFISADGNVNGSYLDPAYVPDELDAVPANASACGMIYSFYGRLSVASLDVEHLKAAELPPTFYCYGTEDPFYRQFEAQVVLMNEVGITTNTMVLVCVLAGCNSSSNGNSENSAPSVPVQTTESKAEEKSASDNITDNSQAEPENNSDSSEDGKTLVVYYSASGYTKAVAETIAETVNADLFEIVPTEVYSEADLNWRDRDSRVSKEYADVSLRAVELASTSVENLDEYDTVFIGYPIWWGIAAWPMDGFAEANDFTGKTVIPFCTSTSSGLGESGELLAELAGTGDWQEGIRFRSGVSSDDVASWVNNVLGN